jgi:hypothetical protein
VQLFVFFLGMVIAMTGVRENFHLERKCINLLNLVHKIHTGCSSDGAQGKRRGGRN